MIGTTTYVPSYPYGDPENNFQVDGDDFYKYVDEVFDCWYDSAQANANLGSALPHELTSCEPESRVVARKDRRHLKRECLRKINPEVATESERLEATERPTKEDCERPFSPSPLACYRAGFSKGTWREKARNNEDWISMEHSALKRAVSRDGADYARELLDRVIAELEIERSEKGDS